MPICDDELTFVCEECYQVIYTDCGVNIVVDLGLTGNTSYCIKLYDKFGNTYNQTVVTTIDGAFILDQSVLPDKFFNKYSGRVELQIFSDCDSETRVSFTVGYMSYNCLLLVNSLDEEVSDVDNTINTSNVVTIKDQDGNLITYVQCGTDYSVLRFSGIKDSGPPYTNSIVDNS